MGHTTPLPPLHKVASEHLPKQQPPSSSIPGAFDPALSLAGNVFTQTLPYDCKDGFANWDTQWSNGKKAWCCKYAGRGCKAIPYQPKKPDEIANTPLAM